MAKDWIIMGVILLVLGLGVTWAVMGYSPEAERTKFKFLAGPAGK